jgi:hypothetical protein
MSTTNHAARIAEANAALRDALLRGDNTAPYRVALHAAEMEAAWATRGAQQAEADRQQREAEEIASGAEAMVSEAHARLRTRLDAIPLPPSFNA